MKHDTKNKWTARQKETTFSLETWNWVDLAQNINLSTSNQAIMKLSKTHQPIGGPSQPGHGLPRAGVGLQRLKEGANNPFLHPTSRISGPCAGPRGNRKRPLGKTLGSKCPYLLNQMTNKWLIKYINKRCTYNIIKRKWFYAKSLQKVQLSILLVRSRCQSF